MRMTPVIGEKVWFGPRRFGWGLDPVSPVGWVVIVTLVGVSVVRKRLDPQKRLVAGLVLAALVAVVILKGTAPGGPRAHAAFKASRAAEPE